MRVSVIQMCPGSVKADNIAQAERLIDEAVGADRPDLVSLPEMWTCLGGDRATKVAQAEALPLPGSNEPGGEAYEFLRARRDVDRAEWRPPCAARRDRPRRRYRGRAAHLRAPRRSAHRRSRHHARQGCERCLGGERGCRPHGGSAPRLSRRALRQDRFVRHEHRRKLRFRHARAAGRRRSRGARRADLSSRLASDADRRHRAAPIRLADILGHAADGVFAEPRQPARHHARHRYPRRRRDRRDREHRPPHPHGKDALSRRARGRRRNWPRRHRDHGHHRRDLRAGQFHGRDRRPVFQAIRPDDRRRRHDVRCSSRVC